MVSTPLFLTVVRLADGTQATVKTFDWNTPDYEVCGFECMTYLPNGESWGTGPEKNDDTPLTLHLYAVGEVAEMRGVGMESNWSL